MAKKKNVREEYMECPICKKKHKVKKWEEDMGKLKNQTIVNDVFCSNKCRNIFYLYLELDCLQERKDEVLKQLEKLGAIKKRKQAKKKVKKQVKKKQTPKKTQKKKKKK